MLRMAHRIATATGFTPVSMLLKCHVPSMSDKIEYSTNAILTEEFENFASGVSEATTLEATNVAEFYANCNKECWAVSDFQLSRPPLPLVFVEWILDGIHRGCLVSSNETMSRFMFCVHLKGCLNFLDAWFEVQFDAPFGIKGICRGTYADYYADMGETSVKMADRILQNDPQLVHVPMLAMSFMNCKNVVRRDETKSLAPSEKWIRRQKAPHIKYHVLDINPMKEVLRTEGGIETNGLKKALHICRGHFAHYENGLFGRGEACTVWRPAHVRGQAENGIVLKDYRVKPGK